MAKLSAKSDLRKSNTVKANYVPVGPSTRIYAVSSMTELPATLLLRPAHTTLPQIISVVSYFKTWLCPLLSMESQNFICVLNSCQMLNLISLLLAASLHANAYIFPRTLHPRDIKLPFRLQSQLNTSFVLPRELTSRGNEPASPEVSITK